MTIDPQNTSMTQAGDRLRAPTIPDLELAYQNVQQHRAVLRDLEDQVRNLKAQFEAEHEALFEARKLAAHQTLEAEEEARYFAVAFYLADPEHKKAVLPGAFGIREVKTVEYDYNVALDWALDHRLAVRLDEAAYRKLVESGLAPGKVTLSPTATITEMQLTTNTTDWTPEER